MTGCEILLQGMARCGRVWNVMPGWVWNVFMAGCRMISWQGVEFQRILNFKEYQKSMSQSKIIHQIPESGSML